MNIGSDHDEAHAGKTCRIYDLPVQSGFGRFEQLVGEKKPHRHITSVFSFQRVVAASVPTRQMLPAVRIDHRAASFNVDSRFFH